MNLDRLTNFSNFLFENLCLNGEFVWNILFIYLTIKWVPIIMEQHSSAILKQGLLKNQETYKSKFQISLIAWSIAISFFHFGYYLIYITQIPTETLKEIYGIDLENGLTEGILNGIVPLGGLFGALGSSYFLEKYSRRTNMLICNVFCFAVGCLIYVQNFPVLIICRFCQGLGTGFFTAVAPLMVRELSPNEIAGALGSYTELNICLGVLIGCIAPYSMLKITGDETAKAYWYLVFGIPQIVIVIQTVSLFIFPYETPKYLLAIGKQEEARKLIEVIYKPEYVQQILEEKKGDIQLEFKKFSMEASGEIQRNEVKRPFFTIQTIVAIHVAVLQQVSGINIVSIYSENIAKQVAEGQLALILPTIINSIQTIATFFSFFLLGRVGRRNILVYGAIIGGISNAMIMVGYLTRDSWQLGQPLILVGIVVFIVGFGLTLGPVAWIFIPEIVEPNVIPYSTTANWLAGSFVIILFPILTEDYLNGNPAVLFAFSTAWCSGSAIINYFYVLETKDKTEKEIRQDYAQLKICQKEI